VSKENADLYLVDQLPTDQAGAAGLAGDWLPMDYCMLNSLSLMPSLFSLFLTA